MNHRAEIATDWADGTYAFRLTVAGALELESKCDAAIAVVAQRLNSGAYRINDVRETIRIGLIGGGSKPDAALRLVRTYVDDRPLMESAVLARVIMGGLMFGFAESPLAPAAGAAERPPVSTPQPSTGTPPSLDWTDDLSVILASGNSSPS